MIVKQDRHWNIPWKPIGLFLLLVAMVVTIFTILYLVIEAKSESNEERKTLREQKTQTKVIDLVSKKYYVTCSKNIISPDNYNIVKVSNTYRVIVGSETKNLDETFNIGDCGVMYNVDVKNLRFKGK